MDDISPERQPPETPPDTPPEDGSTRRGFLGFMTIVLGAVPVVGGLLTSLRSGLAPDRSDKPDRIPLCKLEDVPADGVKQISVSYQVRQGPVKESVARVVFVTRDPESGNVIVLNGECTHLSCPVQKRELRVDKDTTAPLTCPCHGGKFSRTGEVLGGPPPRALHRLEFDEPTEPSDIIYLKT